MKTRHVSGLKAGDDLGLDAARLAKKRLGKAETVVGPDTPKPISPESKTETTTVIFTHGGDAKDEDENLERAAKEAEEEVVKIEDMEERIEELEKQLAREAEKKVPMVANPEMPSKEEVERHNLTHANYQSWCKHCQAGFAARDKHVSKDKKKKGKRKLTKHGYVDVPDTEPLQDGVTKFSIDYVYLNSDDGEVAPATMVMVNHEGGGVWSYATPGKGIQGDRLWLPKRMTSDIDGCGVKDAKIQVKSDQEPAIVVVQEEVREIRKGRTQCTNSPVGESECNGRAENAARRVEVKVRTIRSFLEEKLGCKLDMSKPFATWLIRWAGEILTKYAIGRDGKTAWKRRR